MKKILAFTALCLSVSSLFSQVEKGTKLIGVGFGSFSFTNSNSQTSYSNTPTVYKSDGSSYSISVNPNVGWFVIDNLALGAGVSVSFYGSKSNSSNTSSTNTSTYNSTQPSFYLGPFARYYFKGAEKGRVFTQINGQYGIYGGKSTSKTNYGSASTTTTHPKGDWNVGATAGYEYFINPSIGLFASVGINYGKSKTEYEYKPNPGTGYSYTSEYARFYIPVSVGLQVHLQKKSK